MKRLLHVVRNRFVRDAATLQLGAMLNATGNVVSSVVLAHLLGARLQGVFVVAFSLYALFFFMLNLGVVQATVNQVAAASARGHTDRVGDWLAFLAKVYILLGLLLVGSGYYVLPLITEAWARYGKSNLGVDPHQLGIWAWWLTLIPLIDMPRAVACLLYTSPSPRDRTRSRMPSSA